MRDPTKREQPGHDGQAGKTFSLASSTRWGPAPSLPDLTRTGSGLHCSNRIYQLGGGVASSRLQYTTLFRVVKLSSWQVSKIANYQVGVSTMRALSLSPAVPPAAPNPPGGGCCAIRTSKPSPASHLACRGYHWGPLWGKARPWGLGVRRPSGLLGPLGPL